MKLVGVSPNSTGNGGPMAIDSEFERQLKGIAERPTVTILGHCEHCHTEVSETKNAGDALTLSCQRCRRRIAVDALRTE